MAIREAHQKKHYKRPSKTYRRRSTQLEFGRETKKNTYFGGSFLKGNAREKRPFHKDMYTHLVMRSRLATGERSMLRKSNKQAIEDLVRKAAKQFYVKIERYVNVGSHLHIMIKAPTRQMQANFLRSISGLIVRLIMK